MKNVYKFFKPYNRMNQIDSYVSSDNSDEENVENVYSISFRTTQESFESDLYKTEICKAWQNKKECKWGKNCQFAHGIEELRERKTKHRKFKTTLCLEFHATGYCPYGSRCSFIHDEPFIPQDKNTHKKQRLNCFKKITHATVNTDVPIRTFDTKSNIINQFKYLELI